MTRKRKNAEPVKQYKKKWNNCSDVYERRVVQYRVPHLQPFKGGWPQQKLQIRRKSRPGGDLVVAVTCALVQMQIITFLDHHVIIPVLRPPSEAMVWLVDMTWGGSYRRV